MKDWNGNTKSVYTTLGASYHSQEEREINDFYATDPKAIDDLLLKEKLSSHIWECACGQGHMSKRLQERGYLVISSDLINRGFPGTRIIDFLKFENKGVDLNDFDIVTNPPYKYSIDFILKALDIVKDGHKVCMFLKVISLEGQDRYKRLYSKYPPTRIHVYSKRIQCAKNGEFLGTSAIAYAWFVWEKGNHNLPIIDWII